MAEKNFLPLNRSLLNHWLWKDKPFSKGQAWVDLLLLANYEDKKMPYKGEVVTCKRGDVNISITELAKRWGWSRNSARRFLMLLESDGMVTVNATTHRTTITLEKYGFFNNPCATNEATSGQQVDDKWATSGQQVDTTKKVKKVKKVEKVEKHIYGEYKHVRLTDEEMNRLVAELGEDGFAECIRILDEYKEQTGKTYKNDNLAIRNWVITRYKENISKQAAKPKEGRLDWLDDWGR